MSEESMPKASDERDPITKLFVDFDVKGWVDEYELCADEGYYSPNEWEQVLLVDAIYGVVDHLHEELHPLLARLSREAAPAEEVGASHAIIVDIKHQIERLDLADEAAREDAAEMIIAQVETLISRINAAEQRVAEMELMLASKITTCRDQRVAELERERDGWQRIVGDIASLVPIPEVLKATGKTGDLIAWLKERVARAEAAESQLEAAALRERAKDVELRKALTALDTPDHKLTDTTFLRGSVITAKQFVLAALALPTEESPKADREAYDRYWQARDDHGNVEPSS